MRPIKRLREEENRCRYDLFFLLLFGFLRGDMRFTKSEKEIKKQKSESLLKEIIPSALSSLSDSRINSLNVVDVDCSLGKYSAVVYIDAPFANEAEKREILRQLSIAQRVIQEYTLGATGWFRCPKFTFKFDESFDRVKKLDEIFKEIATKRG